MSVKLSSGLSLAAGIGHPEAHLGHNTRKDEIGIGGTKVPILGARSEWCHVCGPFPPKVCSLKYFTHPPLDPPVECPLFSYSMSQ